jgi:BirA family biotin operon repressor/biotin-[acetyl-CoA-carboxylase] ligase
LLEKMNVNRLQEGLCTKSFGRSIFFSHEADSTNDWAKELAQLGACEGTAAVAEAQTAGRGRLGREWFSPRGGLWFSIVLRPELRPAEAVRLVFVAGLAVAETLREEFGVTVKTKWPNDVLVNGKKICGILLEMNTTNERVNFVVIGVGVNANFDAKVFSEGLGRVATSLKGELGHQVQLEELFRKLLERLENVYELYLAEGFTSILKRWREYAGFLGHMVEVANQTERISGLALDVDQDGALILRLKNGATRRFLTGDVSPRMR